MWRNFVINTNAWRQVHLPQLKENRITATALSLRTRIRFYCGSVKFVLKTTNVFGRSYDLLSLDDESGISQTEDKWVFFFFFLPKPHENGNVSEGASLSPLKSINGCPREKCNRKYSNETIQMSLMRCQMSAYFPENIAKVAIKIREETRSWTLKKRRM